MARVNAKPRSMAALVLARNSVDAGAGVACRPREAEHVIDLVGGEAGHADQVPLAGRRVERHAWPDARAAVEAADDLIAVRAEFEVIDELPHFSGDLLGHGQVHERHPTLKDRVDVAGVLGVVRGHVQIDGELARDFANLEASPFGEARDR